MTGNGQDARQQEPSGRRGKRERPGARRGPDERQTWMRWSEKNRTTEDEFRRTPTWRAKCRISGSGRPLRFKHWGARGDFASYLPAPLASLRSKLREERHKRRMFYTGSGHRCGVIPYSSVWCGGLPLGLMMMNNTRKNSLARDCSCGGVIPLEGLILDA